MGNVFSTKSTLGKTVIVIELNATYSRHTIHHTLEGNTKPTVFTYEKHPYCYKLKDNGSIKSFGYQSFVNLVKENQSKKNRIFYFRNLTHHTFQIGIGLILKDSWGKLTKFKDVLHNVFAYHKAEIISKLLRKEGKHRDVHWIIVLPVGSQLQAKTEIKKAAEDAGLNNDQYSFVFATDFFALYNVTQISRIKATSFTRERDTKQFSSLCFDTELAEKGSYDIFQDGEICNNSRDRSMVNGQSLRDNIEQFLCVIFSKKFIDLYKWKHTYHFHMLCKDFEEQVGQFDIASAEITLQFKHFVDIAREYNCWPKNRLIGATSSLVFSKQEVLQILDDCILNLAKCLRRLLKAHGSSVCYMSMNQCTSSYVHQRLQEELQNNNTGLLGSLVYKEKTITSDFTYGYVAIENFNKELHSDQNKILLCIDDIDEESSIWLFKPLIKMGQSVIDSSRFVWNESITFISKRNKKSDHQAIVIRSKYENPKYIHEEGCEVATTIQVNPPPEGWSDEVEFQYTLTVTKNGQMVEVVDLKSGRKHQAILTYKLNIEFLRDLSSVDMQMAIFSGLKQDILKTRAAFTFGVMTTPPFQKGKDPDYYKFVDNEGVVRKRGVFFKLIKKGTLMSSGQVFSAQVRFVPWVRLFSLYRCPSDNPDIGDGEVVASVRPYRNGLPCAKLEVQLVVGDTNFVFKVIDIESREEWIEDIKQES